MLNEREYTMAKSKLRKNAQLQGLFYGFSGMNAFVAGGLGDGDRGLQFISFSLLLAAFAVAMDSRKSSNQNGAVWGALLAHLFLTGFVLLVSFHWIIVVLYLLELALCIYVWRIK